MAVHEEIQYAGVDDLLLDPRNPRLGRNIAGPKLSQEKVLELMKGWTLEELAVSFLESGFWPQEALLVVKEPLYGRQTLVVVEGNRRLATLIFLKGALDGRPESPKWKEIARSGKLPAKLFSRIPYILVDSRNDVDAFLGFRHVTGIKEWKPAEKAQYIARLIEHGKIGYKEVMRKIGSKTPTVRRNYITYRLLLQMENQEDIAVEQVEEKFSVLYLSLRTAGVCKYLQIDIEADPKHALRPAPKSRLDALTHFALWLFGDNKTPPIVRESRQVDEFGRILQSKLAVAYLERTEKPSFEIAYRIAGGDEPELVNLIERAADNIEAALGRAHLHTKSRKLQAAVERSFRDAYQLVEIFPEIKKCVLTEKKLNVGNS